MHSTSNFSWLVIFSLYHRIFIFLIVLMNSHAVCDGTFFPSLLQEMSAVVGCFNDRAKKLLEMHLSSSFKKFVLWFFGNSYRSHGSLIQEGKDLVTYAIINAIAMRKILKKYDKVSVVFFDSFASMTLEYLYLQLLSRLSSSEPKRQTRTSLVELYDLQKKI